MSTPDSSRLFVFVSLQQTRLLPALHAALAELAAGEPADCGFSVHLAARHFPSTWGRVSRSQPVQADPDALSPDELKLWQAWFKEGRFGLLPAGFAGAQAAMLSPEEFRSEIAWTLSNPWKSGFADCFGEKPEILLPFWPLPSHPELQAQVRQHFPCCGRGRLEGRQPQLVCESAEGLLSIPLLDLDTQAKRGMAEQIREFFRHQPPGDLAVRCEFSARAGLLPELAKALQALAQEGIGTTRRPRFHHLDTLHPEASHQAAGSEWACQGLIRSPAGLSPDLRRQWLELAEGRRGRSATQERLRSQLLASLPHDSAYRLPVQAAPALLARSILANMEGEAAIRDERWEARFEAGAWQGFFETGGEERAVRFDGCDRAGLGINGRHWHYEMESSVSFETDHSRGLRNSLRLKLPGCRIPGRMITDYVLSDHAPQLLVDVQLRYPWLEDGLVANQVEPYRFGLRLPAGVDKLSVAWEQAQLPASRLELTPPPLGENPGAADRQPWWQRLSGLLHRETEARHGEAHAAKCFEHSLPGHAWTLRWEHQGRVQGLSIRRLPAEENAQAPLELCLRHDAHGQGWLLEIHPEGRYGRVLAAELRSLNHHFVLALAPLFGADAEAPGLPAAIEKECSPFFLVRES